MKQTEKIPFSRYYDERKKRKEISDASIALIVPGIVLTAVFAVRSFASVGPAEKISLAAAAVGLALIALGTFAPRRAAPVTKKIAAFFNRLGVLLLRTLLVPVYLITYLLSFWYAKIRKRDYSFAQWDGAPPVRETCFEKEENAKLNTRKAFRVIGSIFAGIAAHKLYILIPLAVVLLLIGLLFFFISSSTVFSFIYTFV